MSKEETTTQGVKTLVGDPKKAIMKLALPMILAMSVQVIYNLVDAFWVSGLGANALAAVGLFFPFFFMMLALATGLGVGGGAAISRRIGAKDKNGANNVATHTMVFMVIVSLAITLPLLLLAEPMFIAIGAGTGETLEYTLAYSNVLFGGAIILFFANVANALLRGEGDAKRAMYAMMLGGIINIILDPILIYTLDMGIAGAAWATLISLGVSAALLFYWLFMKKDTYIDIAIRKFKYSKEIAKDIFKVGVPASVQQLTMSINMLLLNIIIIGVAGTDGVAVITTGWRILTLGVLPLMGIATAVVSVCGAAYGMGKYNRMDSALKYAIKIGLMIVLIPAVAFFLMAGQIAAVFTQAESAAHLAPDLTRFFLVAWLFLPTVAHGMLSGAMFQGAGKGMNALVLTLFRTVLLTPALAWFLAVSMGMGLDGVWWGLVVANIAGSVVSYTWARIYINGLKKQKKASKAFAN